MFGASSVHGDDELQEAIEEVLKGHKEGFWDPWFIPCEEFKDDKDRSVRTPAEQEYAINQYEAIIFLRDKVARRRWIAMATTVITSSHHFSPKEVLGTAGFDRFIKSCEMMADAAEMLNDHAVLTICDAGIALSAGYDR